MINKKTVSEAYVDRDLSWMYFNRRILQEAAKEQVPLLDRLSFLGIYSNNLDEFFVSVWLRSAVLPSVRTEACDQNVNMRGTLSDRLTD